MSGVPNLLNGSDLVYELAKAISWSADLLTYALVMYYERNSVTVMNRGE
jgi:hypothetical protein